MATAPALTTSTLATDYEGLIKEDRVHGRLYYDPAIFQEEMEKIWHRVWVYVGHESEVAQPGDYITRRIGLQPVIMTRDEEGQVHLVLNRCSHRANMICVNERGNANFFRCPYHGWTFNNRGECLGVPFKKAYGESFRREDSPLAKVPRMDAYRGFVFGSLSPTGISLDEYLGVAARYIDQFVDQSPEGEIELCAGTQKVRYDGNWKMQLENLPDAYHGLFTHESFMTLMKEKTGLDMTLIAGEKSPATSLYLGHGHTNLDFRLANRQMAKAMTLNLSGRPNAALQTYLAALEKRHGPERARQIIIDGSPHLQIFPNVILMQKQVRRIQPISADETYIYYQPAFLKGVAPEINTARLREHETFYSPAGFGNPDDVEMFRRNQLGLEARVNEWLILRRGIETERVDEEGVHVGHLIDEGQLRGIWRYYKELMLQPYNSTGE